MFRGYLMRLYEYSIIKQTVRREVVKNFKNRFMPSKLSDKDDIYDTIILSSLRELDLYPIFVGSRVVISKLAKNLLDKIKDKAKKHDSINERELIKRLKKHLIYMERSLIAFINDLRLRS